MKSLIKLCLVLLLIAQVSSFAQETKILNKKVGNKNLISNITNSPNAFTNLITNNLHYSTSPVAPLGNSRYIRTIYIISASELAAAGVANGSKFYSWGFNYYTAPTSAISGNFKLYLQNSSDALYSKTATTWTNGTDGILDAMTLVHDGTLNLPATDGPVDITLSNGTAFTYTGGSIYVAFDFQNPSGTVLAAANGALINNTLVGGANGTRYSYSTTAVPTTVTYTSASRPETRAGFTTGIAKDASVDALFSYGKLAVNISSAPISALISNTGDETLTNLTVTLSITGANTFTSTKTIASLPRDGASVVTFDAFTPTAVGNNVVTVTVPSDGKNTNNTKTSAMVTTTNAISAADTSVATNSIGYNTGSGLLLVKYSIKGSATVNSINIQMGSSTSKAAGNTVYGVLLDKTGAIVAKSANYVIQTADLDKRVTFTFPTPVSVKDQDIYVGLAQTANATTGYFPLGSQDELAGRPSTFFTAALAGGALSDESASGFCFVIEANVTSLSVPVELASFTSSVKDGIVTLSWMTATETNNSGFQVERKAAKEDSWTVLGFVKGNSTTSNISRYTYTDNVAKLGEASYSYRLKQMDFDGTYKYYTLNNSVEISTPKTFSLDQNYPNPFNPSTTIAFSVPSDSKVSLQVYDILGKVVKTLVNGQKAAGSYTVSFDASSLSSGVYFYKLTAGENSLMKKMNLIK